MFVPYGMKLLVLFYSTPLLVGLVLNEWWDRTVWRFMGDYFKSVWNK